METVEDILKGSFLKFLWYVWTRVVELPEPTRVQMDIARFLEKGPRKRFIAAFRGVGKTYLTGAYVVWRLWKNPKMKVLVVSANETFAGKVSSFIHQIINGTDALTGDDVPWAELRAKRGQRDSGLQFDVGPAGIAKDPSVFAVGINGQLPGSRADLILSDDVEVPTNSETEAQREKLESRTGEYAAVVKPGGETIYLGTFQSMSSIYRKLRSKGYAMRLWPARYPLEKKLPLYEEHMAPILLEDIKANPALMRPTGSTLGGAPTDPQRFHEEDLMERESEWGLSGYQLQFMLDTSLTDAERFPLKTGDFMVMDVPTDIAPVNLAWSGGPQQVIRDIDNVGFDGGRFYRPLYVSDEWKPYTGSLLQIDPSGGGTDETAYVVTKFLNGKVYIRRWGGFQDGHSEETLKALTRIAIEESVNLIRVEGNFGDGMFSRLLETELRRGIEVDGVKQTYKGAVEDHKVSGQKEARIVALIKPALKAHRIVIDSQVVHDDLREAKTAKEMKGGFGVMEFSSLYQLTHMTEKRGALRKDDRIDALASAMEHWAEYMALDSAKEEAKEKHKADVEFAKMVLDTQPFFSRPTPKGRGTGRRVGQRVRPLSRKYHV